MDRRTFIKAGAVTAIAVGGTGCATNPTRTPPRALGEDVRALFPRLAAETYLNAAKGTPLSTFTESGLRRYEDFWRSGPGDGRGEAVQVTLDETRARFARLIGAATDEIAFVHCTKAGEQIVLDGVPGVREGGNVVTNDLHFSGSLHNLEGLRRTGVDVRVVRGDRRDVGLDAMKAAVDDRTALVCVTLVSNLNGRIEALPALAAHAHERGALVYADIIQAAGIVPIDVKALDVDFAACSTYKWLYGPHGTGFLYVRKDRQGRALEDRLFPGHVRHNYTPWVDAPDPDHGAFVYSPRIDGRRYEPGHVSYLGYCAVHAGLEFIARHGPASLLAHSVGLNQRLHARLDPERFPCWSPHVDRSPIITFRVRDPDAVRSRLRAAGVVVALRGHHLRVSPGPYNVAADIDRLAEGLE